MDEGGVKLLVGRVEGEAVMTDEGREQEVMEDRERRKRRVIQFERKGRGEGKHGGRRKCKKVEKERRGEKGRGGEAGGGAVTRRRKK